MDPSSCIKTLSSSGLTTNGAVVVATSTTGGRSLAPLPPGETQINDIGLTPSGYGLFSAAADKVRVFFLKYFFRICRLSDSTVPTDAGIEPRTQVFFLAQKTADLFLRNNQCCGSGIPECAN
jgi:hypothetical protein